MCDPLVGSRPEDDMIKGKKDPTDDEGKNQTFHIEPGSRARSHTVGGSQYSGTNRGSARPRTIVPKLTQTISRRMSCRTANRISQTTKSAYESQQDGNKPETDRPTKSGIYIVHVNDSNNPSNSEVASLLTRGRVAKKFRRPSSHSFIMPFPVTHFGHVLAKFTDVLLVLDALVVNELFY